ncbi:hypothetical protein FACS1894190_13380 [Spirochaetia bacterium]|nr:hypothetical protein FACS1894190_13380 [Spirochaetia bacterium]
MNQATAIRKELHAFIDTMPDGNVYALKPLFTILSESAYSIETDLTDEEHALIAASVKHYHEHPETFVTLDSLK